MAADLGEFMLTENGTLILSDDCGNYMPILKEGKYIIDIRLDTQGTIVKRKPTTTRGPKPTTTTEQFDINYGADKGVVYATNNDNN